MHVIVDNRPFLYTFCLLYGRGCCALVMVLVVAVVLIVLVMVVAVVLWVVVLFRQRLW